jgi:hypothetical protein
MPKAEVHLRNVGSGPVKEYSSPGTPWTNVFQIISGLPEGFAGRFGITLIEEPLGPGASG